MKPQKKFFGRDSDAGRWMSPDDVENGNVYIAWVNGTMLASFQLLTKDGSDWLCEKTGAIVPREWIAAVAKLPDPRLIGPNWQGGV